MVDVKMTTILVSTSHFLATLTYPIKTKIAEPISKNVVNIYESVDAVIEVSPIIHHDLQRTEELTEKFYEVLSQESGMGLTKKKERQLREFLEMCGEKIRAELRQLSEETSFNFAADVVNTIYINLLDASGNVVMSTKRRPQDIVASLTHIRTRIMLWKRPPKQVSGSLPFEETQGIKPHHNESGMTRRHLYYGRRAA